MEVPIGSGEFDEAGFITAELAPGEFLLSFSDGIVDGSRRLSKAAAAISQTLKTSKPTVDGLKQLLIDLAAEHPIYDDKTILVIERVK